MTQKKKAQHTNKIPEEPQVQKCSFCGTASSTLQKCSRCLEVQYCNSDCQKKHWKDHKAPCNQKQLEISKAIQAVRSRSDETFITAAKRYDDSSQKQDSLDAEKSKLQDDQVDETGLVKNEVDSIVEIRQCRRSEAVKAMRDNQGDVINAIMSLTPGVKKSNVL